MKRIYILIALTICLVSISSVVHSAVLEVGAGKPYTTIQSAIDDSNGGDTVLVYDGTYNELIDFKGKAITLNSANGAAKTVIDGSGLGDSIVKFVNGETGTSVLDGFTLTNGHIDEYTNKHGGGGIYCSYSSPTITNCTITDNRTGLDDGGGGIYCSYSSPTITNCTISGNMTGSGGGGIWCFNSPLTITNCTISGNKAYHGAGGGIWCFNSPLTITNCTISGNETLSSGAGGIHCDNSSLTITNCTITGNQSRYGPGGGIYCDNASLTITNCTISGNNGGEEGGGGIVVMGNSPSTITNCTISNNGGTGGAGVSGEGAGGISCGSSSTITNCTITGNYGHGIQVYSSSSTITNCTITGNYGHGIQVYSSSPTITNCTISGNKTFHYTGGGIYCYYSSPTITNCTITGNNSARFPGGGIYCDNSSPTIKNCILWDNTAYVSPSQISGEAVVTYSDIDQDGYGNPDGSADANGNIRLTPLFIRNPNPGADGHWGGIDDDYGDLHLQAGSPCIDTGTSAGAPAYDIEGTMRPQGSGFDMGAYEYKGETTIAVDIKPGSCPNPIGFADNNGVVPFAIMGTVSGFDMMGTVEDFDVTQIDPESIRITRDGVDAEVAPIRWTYEDVATPFEGELCNCHWLKGDGIMDLSMKAYTNDLVDVLKLKEVAGETIPLTITGKLKDEFGGTPIEGKDCVRILKAVLKGKK